MSTYELDDEKVRLIVDTVVSQNTRHGDAWVSLQLAMKDQLPLPVPQKIGAIVKTDKGVYVRWAIDSSAYPWFELGLEGGDMLEIHQIGRIKEVPFEGLY